jgi:hypothetical protein
MRNWRRRFRIGHSWPRVEDATTIDDLMPEPDEAAETARIDELLAEHGLDEDGDLRGAVARTQLRDVGLRSRERERQAFVDRFSLPQAFPSQEVADEAAVAYHAKHRLRMVTVRLRDGSFRVVPRAAAEEARRQWYLDERGVP